jgi:fructose/tagatose bisphosphate aldolase
VPLVLHGSTGVPDGELRQAVAAGMVKVNIGTALNAAFTGAVRDTLAAAPVAVDPRPALTAPGDGRCRDVGAAGAVGRRVRDGMSGRFTGDVRLA